jgi:disulfide bond formation protein DsbB
MFSKIQLNFAGFLVCAGLMAYALYAEHVLKLEPCPLCMLQRVAVIALGLVFLAAGLHRPGRVGSAIDALLIFIISGAGAVVAGRHVWLQNLPPDKVPACGPDWDFMMSAFPLGEMLQMILSGSGECAEISWSLLGFSMPAWVMFSFVLLGLFGIYNNTQRN